MIVCIYDVRFARKDIKTPGNYGFAIVVARSRQQAKRTFESDTGMKVDAMYQLTRIRVPEPDVPFRPVVVYRGKLWKDD